MDAPVDTTDEVVCKLAEMMKFVFGMAETVVKQVKQERGLQ